MKKRPFKDNAQRIADDLGAQLEKLKPSPQTVTNVHNNFRRFTNQFDLPGPEMRSLTDFNVPHETDPVPVRLYEPFAAPMSPSPVILYLHGGGFVTCSLESHDGICRRLANGSGHRVLSVDYRLAPQFPYPAGPDDCERVLNWLLESGGEIHNLDAKHLIISGDSAGGNMAAYLAQKYRKDIRAQILFYPLMQLVEMKPMKPGPQDVLQLGVMALKYIDEHYVGDADTHLTRLSPLFETNLKGVPPAYILTCGLDPLRDEGKLYADKLAYNGTPVTYVHEKMLPHGFLNFVKAFPAGKKIPLEAADFIRKYDPQT